MNVSTVLLDCPLKKPPTLGQGTAALALWEEKVLPVGNRLPRISPKGGSKDTKLMVIERDRNAPHWEIAHGPLQFILVVERIDPEICDVPRSVADIFQSHECDVLYKWEIAIDVLHQSIEARDREAM
jgi:hypothetical protein